MVDNERMNNDVSCINRLVDDICVIMADAGFNGLDIVKMWNKPNDVVEQFLIYNDPTILTVKDLLELAALLGRRLVIKFE